MSTSTVSDTSTRTDWFWFAGVCLVMLAAYLTTLCPTVYWYDSAEFATAAATLGIPHPPGYPVYTLLGKLYVMLLPGEPAVAVNAMSAVHGALCIGLLFLLQLRMGAERIPALCGAAIFGTGPSFWFNSSVAEVYTTGLVFALLVWLLLLTAIKTGRRADLIAAAFVGGLGFATHMFVATLGLGYLLLVWTGSAGRASDSNPMRARLQTLGLAALATLIGASAYLYIPWRVSMHPALSFINASSPRAVLYMLTGGPYKDWFFHDYDHVARTFSVLAMLDDHMTDLGLILGFVGLGALVLQQRMLGLAFLLACLGNMWFFFNYDVHDVEVFFLPTAALLSACIGPLLTTTRRVLAGRASTRMLANVALGVCLAYVALRVAIIAPKVDLSHERAAQRFGQTLVATLPHDAIVMNCGTPGEWKYRTVFDNYFQMVLGARPDVLALAVPGELMQDFVATAGTPTALPPFFANVFASGRPVYMYVDLDDLRPLFTFSREGEMFRVTPKLK